MVAFRVPQRSITVLRECVLEETLPARHPARFIWSVLEGLDFGAIESQYKSVSQGTGRPPYHPRILAALWIYAMTRGIGTASEIAEACTIRDDFRWLAGGLAPCDQTLLNFLSIAGTDLPGVWEQVLKAMQAAGCIDLSVLAEDGTKLRANASRRSFHSAGEVNAVVEKLKSELARELEKIVSPEATKAHKARLQGLKGKLERAMQAAAELRRRKERRERGTDEQHSLEEEVQGAEAFAPEEGTPTPRQITKLRTAEFTHHPGRDVLLCPEKQELRFVGMYATNSGSGSYRLYKRADCTGCPLKARCTDAKGRRVKLPVVVEPAPATAPGDETPASSEDTSPSDHDASTGSKTDDQTHRPDSEPQASLTDPEALLMLATSEKRFEPSYNADITVTRYGVIVSQFLTKVPVDYPNFARALPKVISTLGRPEKWTGDGHYATQANLALAQREAVLLFAPTPNRAEKANGSFTAKDFHWNAETDVLACPAGWDLEKVGTYGQDQERPYDLYVRRDCTGCEFKAKCTTARGRRVKRYHQHALVQALETRMEQDGEKMRKYRGSTVEPVNGQLKQHGLQRFHVRGLARCQTVLTLACTAHNLMKWRGMEEGKAALKQAAS